MTSDNHTRIGEGFRELLQTLAPHVCAELWRKYGADWWQKGVLNVLRDEHKRNLPAGGDNKTLCRSLDIQRCLILFEAHWPTLFSRRLPEECRAWANDLHHVRNRWAHANAEDFSDNFTRRALEIMRRFRERLEALRNRRAAGTASATPAIPPLRMERDAAERRHDDAALRDLDIDREYSIRGEIREEPEAPRPKRWGRKALVLAVCLLAACAAFFYFQPQYGKKLFGGKSLQMPKQVRQMPDKLKQALPNKAAKDNANRPKPGKKGRVQCWQDADGNMIYTNIAPADKGMKPCR